MPPPAPPPVSDAAVAPAETDAEATVRATIARDGVHVVHFWAPWCDNSTAELGAGWYEVVERHPDVSFSFVTLWNDGETGGATLDRYAIPDRVARLVVPGVQPPKGERQTTFLGLPVTWIPATWVFNRNGQLATAFNYGEATPEQLSAAIDGAASTWPH
ncbi:MAG TPA: thioredoxin, partial [Rubricoccaceae bacterium]